MGLEDPTVPTSVRLIIPTVLPVRIIPPLFTPLSHAPSQFLQHTTEPTGITPQCVLSTPTVLPQSTLAVPLPAPLSHALS